MKITKRIIEIATDSYKIGIKEAAEKYEISRRTVHNYRTLINEQTTEELQKQVRGYEKILTSEEVKIINELVSKFTVSDLKTMARGFDISKNKNTGTKINLRGNNLKIGVLSDTHIGSKYFREDWWDLAFETFENEKVAFVCHVGDLVEGLSSRPGHWQDLTHIGYDAQKEYSIELLKRTHLNVYGIDGNHDRWYIKSANALICKDVAAVVPNYYFIGSDEGDIYINDKLKIKLWHGEDGNSYAISYRIQKLIESFTPGTEPDLLLCGHVHKALYLPYERNIHAISCGALSTQSKWMRSKKLANHSGFWVLDINFSDDAILSMRAEFFGLKF